MRPISLRSRSAHKAKQFQRKPQLERLELRHLLSAFFGSSSRGGMISGGVCTCPICSGAGLPAVSATPSESGPEESVPISNVPQYSSNSGATAKLYLDFNGHFESSWGSYSNVNTPAFDTDGDVSTFSDSELSSIYQIWAAIAE